MFIIELIAILITIAGLFIWNRAESRSDIRHMDNKIDSMRNLIDAIREDSKAFQNAIREEMRDFHNRLCDIERNRNK